MGYVSHTALGNISPDRPAARISSSGSQSIPNNAFTGLTFDVEDYDSDNMANLGTSNSRLTVVTPGMYVVHAHSGFAANATGQRILRIMHYNSVGTLLMDYSSDATVGTASANWEAESTNLFKCSAGDYFQVHAYQNTGGAAATAANNSGGFASLTAAWVGGTGAAWGNAGASANISVDLTTFPNNAWTTLSLAAETIDVDGMHSTSTNPERLTCKTPGLYRPTAFVLMSSPVATTYTRAARVYHYDAAGTLLAQIGYWEGNVANTGTYSMPISCRPVFMNTGEYLLIQAYQNSGSLCTVYSAYTFLSAERLGYQTNPSQLLTCKMHATGTYSTPATSGWLVLHGSPPLLTATDWDLNEGVAQADTTNGRIYCRKKGIYRVDFQIGVTATYTGLKGISIMKNGALNGYMGGHTHWVDDTASPYRMISTEMLLDVGDYVAPGFYNVSAVARSLDVAYTGMSMTLVRAI